MMYSLRRNEVTHGFDIVHNGTGNVVETFGRDELATAEAKRDALNRGADAQDPKAINRETVSEIMRLRKELGWTPIPRARVTRILRDGRKKLLKAQRTGKRTKLSKKMKEHSEISWLGWIHGPELGHRPPYNDADIQRLRALHEEARRAIRLHGLITRAKAQQPKAAAEGAKKRRQIGRMTADMSGIQEAELEKVDVAKRSRAAIVGRKIGHSASWVRRLRKR